MQEVKHDEIIYEEGWRETAPVVKDKSPADETPIDEAPASDDQKTEKAKYPSLPLLITVQLALCLTAALVLFLLKAMDSDSYHRFMSYYREEEQKPLISRDVFKAVDIGALFSENAVTIQATPDETAPAEY